MLTEEKKSEIFKQITSQSWIEHFFNNTLKRAIDTKTSDIHIKIWDEKTFAITFNVDWTKVVVGKFNRISQKWEDIFNSIRTYTRAKAWLRTDEIHLPQDWALSIIHNWKKYNMRVSLMPWKYWTFDIVMRVLDSDKNLSWIDTLPFPKQTKPQIKKLLDNFHSGDGGLVLVTWPIWSWKTTTLYTFIDYIMKHSPWVTIKTLEDPIEYEIPWVDQSEIDESHWYTFAKGLKAILRQNPDVIIVWEVRDEETAKLVIQAALTWHLVISTMHVNSSIEVYERLMDFWVMRTMIRQTLKLVLCQRLQKKLCDCKISISEEKSKYKDVLDFIKENTPAEMPEDKKKQLINSFKTKNNNPSCPKCHGQGTSWRIAIFDVLLFTEEVIDVFEEFWHKHKNELKKELFKYWYIDLETDLNFKIAQWMIDSELMWLFDT